MVKSMEQISLTCFGSFSYITNITTNGFYAVRVDIGIIHLQQICCVAIKMIELDEEYHKYRDVSPVDGRYSIVKVCQLVDASFILEF